VLGVSSAGTVAVELYENGHAIVADHALLGNSGYFSEIPTYCRLEGTTPAGVAYGYTGVNTG